MYADGGGLYLRVTPQGTKNWVLRYMLDRRPRWMGLGPLALYGLAEARARALDARRKRYEGIDPIEARRAARARERLDAAQAITFGEVAKTYITAHKAGWRNGKHKAQWENTLKSHAAPIMSLPVQSIDTALTLKVLERIWTANPRLPAEFGGDSKASSISQRSEVTAPPKIRRAGAAIWTSCYRRGPRCERQCTMPPCRMLELPTFLTSLRTREAVAARALEFLILTAARTGEVIGARWNEMDLLDKTWTVPASRMKANREHRVPLHPRAVAILGEMQAARQSDDGNAYVFPAAKPGTTLSNMAFLMLLRRMRLDDLTVHGFRSTFRDWAAERTNYPKSCRGNGIGPLP